MKKLIKIIFLSLSCLTFLFSNELNKEEKNKPSFSIIKSVIFPGWGELEEYNKHKKDYILKRSKILNFIEGALIYSFYSSNSLSESYEDDYKNYGAINAGVYWSGKNNAFAIQVGKFEDTDAYNNYVNSIGNSESQYSINPENGYWWDWNNESKRVRYSNLRKDSESMKDIRTLMIAGLLINRFVSFFDVIAIKKREENSFSFDVKNSKNSSNVSLNFSF